MSYRGVQRTRIDQQLREIRSQNAYTAIWRKYVSAAAGVAAAGQGSAYYYATAIITGWFGNRVVASTPEHQSPAGLIAAGDVYCVTKEQLDRRDEIVWRGATYRVEGDPVPAKMAGDWVVGLKRTTP